MAARRKRRRTIVVDGESYAYWVADDEDGAFSSWASALNVVSEDRTFYVRYHLDQPPDRRHVIVIGSRFRDRTEVAARWRRYRSAAFAADADGVKALVRFCVSGSDAPVEVDERGEVQRQDDPTDARLWKRTLDVIEVLVGGTHDDVEALAQDSRLGVDEILRTVSRRRAGLRVPASAADARFTAVRVLDAVHPTWSVQCDVGALTVELTLRQSERGEIRVEIDDLTALR